MRDAAALLPEVIGPFERYCASCGLSPAAAYVTTPLIGIGVTPLTCSHGGSQMLDQTIAFDLAESDAANVTQTNMVTVSSFNGPRGLLLGYDLLRQPLSLHPLLERTQVFDAEPLFAATQALYGTVKEPRFPIAPGEHLLCASKQFTRTGPCLLYGALAIGIAAERALQADLFLEDFGILAETDPPERQAEQEQFLLARLVDAVGKIGDNLGVRYDPVFVGLRSRVVGVGEIGCVLTAAPYIHLARYAVPSAKPECLAALTLLEWEALVRPDFHRFPHPPSLVPA